MLNSDNAEDVQYPLVFEPNYDNPKNIVTRLMQAMHMHVDKIIKLML